MRIGFAYDKPAAPGVDTSDAVAAEYEDNRTIDWLNEALSSLGDVVDLPWDRDFASKLVEASVNLIFNITEAWGSRNRESLVPAIAETFGIPCTGTDSVGLGLSLDKMVTKELAANLGIATPAATMVSAWSDASNAIELGIKAPVLVKPNTGGSSLGIHENSRFYELESAISHANSLYAKVGAEVLIEEFVSGRDIAVALLEHNEGIEVFPHAELVVGDGGPDEFYSVEKKQRHEKRIICPAALDPDVSQLLQTWSVRLFRRLGCVDFARIDYRLAGDGRPYLLEVNPLPGLSPYYGIYHLN